MAHTIYQHLLRVAAASESISYDLLTLAFRYFGHKLVTSADLRAITTVSRSTQIGNLNCKSTVIEKVILAWNFDPSED